MIVFDTNALVKLASGAEDDDFLRIRGVVIAAEKARDPIGIPAPAFAEFLVDTDQATTEILAMFERKQAFRILPFDKRAAHECALLDRDALATRRKRSGLASPRQKVKVDRQIAAIARVHGADQIISNDGDIRAIGMRVGMVVHRLEDLPIPEQDRQRKLGLSAQPGSSDDIDV